MKGKKKVFTFGQGHMTKMAPPCAYMVFQKKSSGPEPVGWLPLTLLCSIWDSSTIKYINGDRSLILTYFTARSNVVP